MTDTAAPHEKRVVNGLVVSGLVQIAVGALTGFPYAAATYKPGLARQLGIEAPRRIRQLHLDLVMMGGLVTATGAALPRLPRAVAVPLAIGCWTNALAFAPPAVRPSIEQSKPFRVMVGTSFAVTTVRWVAVAGIALRRWTRQRQVIPAPVPRHRQAGHLVFLLTGNRSEET